MSSRMATVLRPTSSRTTSFGELDPLSGLGFDITDLLSPVGHRGAGAGAPAPSPAAAPTPSAFSFGAPATSAAFCTVSRTPPPLQAACASLGRSEVRRGLKRARSTDLPSPVGFAGEPVSIGMSAGFGIGASVGETVGMSLGALGASVGSLTGGDATFGGFEALTGANVGVPPLTRASSVRSNATLSSFGMGFSSGFGFSSGLGVSGEDLAASDFGLSGILRGESGPRAAQPVLPVAPPVTKRARRTGSFGSQSSSPVQFVAPAALTPSPCRGAGAGAGAGVGGGAPVAGAGQRLPKPPTFFDVHEPMDGEQLAALKRRVAALQHGPPDRKLGRYYGASDWCCERCRNIFKDHTKPFKRPTHDVRHVLRKLRLQACVDVGMRGYATDSSGNSTNHSVREKTPLAREHPCAAGQRTLELLAMVKARA